MEPELENFLREREAATEDAIFLMKEEKIDMAALKDMEEAGLRKFIPKMGDRIATVRFCKLNTISTDNRRMSLIERIKLSQTVTTNVEASSPLAEKKKYSHNLKTTRQISLGWIKNGVTIRGRNGGGSRSCTIAKDARKQNILDEALKKFFPEGVSNCGDALSKYTYDLLDYKEHIFDSTFTVGEMYEMTGLSVLRFYLSTNSLDEESWQEEESKNKKPKRKRISKKKDAEHGCKVHKENEYIEKENRVNQTPNQETFENDIDDNIHDFNIGEEIFIYDNDEIALLQEDVTIDSTSINLENNIVDIASLDSTTNTDNTDIIPSSSSTVSSSRSLIVHRGQIFEEITSEFINLNNLNCHIDVEIIGTNGEKESAYDGGGVFKDALSEYWANFYETLCDGTTVKIPEINYLISEEKWRAIAKVLLIGYKQTKYFPIKLPKPLIEYVFSGKPKSSLEDAYLCSISCMDADVIRKAMDNIHEVDREELLDALSNIDCKQIVNNENVNNVIRNLAHTTVIQKPKFVLDCWAGILRNALSSLEIDDIYENSVVTNKKVSQLIWSSQTESNAEEEKVLGYLKRFLREGDHDILCRFLRFCTGADVITCNFLQVEFGHLTGAERRPTSHTCNNILVLPVSYSKESYRVFKFEMSNVLKSNMWCMDMV